MRWIAAITITTLLSASGGYYYWKNYLLQPDAVYKYCPADTKIVLVADQTNALIALLTDSASIFKSHPNLSQFASAIDTFLTPLKEIDAPIVLAINELGRNPALTAIVPTSKFKNKHIEGSIISDSEHWLIYSNRIKAIDPNNSSIVRTIEDASSTAKGNVVAIFDPNVLLDLLLGATREDFHKQLKAEINIKKWLATELKNDSPFTINSATQSSTDRTNPQQSQNLLKSLPSKTNAAICFSSKQMSRALVHVPYAHNPKSENENLFLIIQDSVESSSDSFEIESVSKENLPPFSPEWTEAVKTNIGHQILYASSKSQVLNYIEDIESYSTLSNNPTYRSMAAQISDAEFTLFAQHLTLPDEPNIITCTNDNNQLNALVFQINAELMGIKHYAFSATFKENSIESIPIYDR